MRQYLLVVPKSTDIGFLGIKSVLIFVPLKSLVPPVPLFKGHVVPFILVIPLKSLINALCHILFAVPKLPERLNGTIFPLMLICVALIVCI